jgi:hypothetical protein
MKMSREDKIRAQTQDREGKSVITNINLPARMGAY